MTEAKVHEFMVESSAGADDLLSAVEEAGKEEQELKDAKKAKQKKQKEKLTGSEFKEAIKALKPKKTDEEIRRQASLIDKLLKYYNHPMFHEMLQARGFEESMKPTNLKKMEIPELEELLVQIRSYVANMNEMGIITQGYYVGLQAVENASVSAPLNRILPNFTGATELAKQDGMIKTALAEIEIENGDFIQMTPTRRLIVATILSLGGAAVINRNTTAMKEELISALRQAQQQAQQQASQEEESHAATEPLEEDDGRGTGLAGTAE